MALSGTSSYEINAAEIIETAFEKLGYVSEGDSLTAEQMVRGKKNLNLLIKKLVADGFHLWATQRGVLFPTTTSVRYLIGATSPDHVVAESDLISTSTTASASSGATSIVVASATNISSPKNIGIRQTNGTYHWTTVSSVVGLTVNLSSALTANVDSGAAVYVYANKMQRPSRIIEARCKTSETSEIPMEKLSHTDYYGLTNKDASGTPTQYLYEPTLYNGTLSIWSKPNSVDNFIKFTAERVLQDVNLVTENVDLPQEWLLPLAFNLALLLTYDYNVDDSTFQKISAAAVSLLEDARDFDQEEASLILAPQMT